MSAAPTLDRRRMVIENVRPQIDGGRFPIKRTAGEDVVVEADVFADGHSRLAGVLRYRFSSGGAVASWEEIALRFVDNDRWTAPFTVRQIGVYEYTLEAWIDAFGSWRAGLSKWLEAGNVSEGELLEGAELIAAHRSVHGQRVPATRSSANGACRRHRAAAIASRAVRRAAHIGLRTAAAADDPIGSQLAAWARGWEAWTSASFLEGYLDAAAAAVFMPADADQFRRALELFMLDKALYELQYEINNRPDWAATPLRGVMQILESGAVT